MDVAFHAGANFYLGGGVLLYFIVWVEVIKIQIWFEIKIDLKFIKDLEKERRYSIFPSLMGWNPANPPAQPSQPALQEAQQFPARMARQATGRPNEAQPTRYRWPRSAAQASSSWTRTVHGVYPLPINPNRSVSEMEWRIKTASQSNPLRDMSETPIYRWPYCQNFDPQEPNPRAWTKLILRLDFTTASAIGA
jgi:hypothetical protein